VTRRKKIRPARQARTIEEATVWLVCTQVSLFLDRDSLVPEVDDAQQWFTEEEAAAAAQQHHAASGRVMRVMRARRTNLGAENLMQHRVRESHKLETLALELGVSVKYAHGLCWGLTLPSLPVAGVISDHTGIPLHWWLEPLITPHFPNFEAA